jgi:DNA-binding NarL/FixJ family response regulator
MTKKERSLIGAILFGIIVMVSLDLATDYREGVIWWHVLIEGAVALGAGAGIYILMRESFQLYHSLESERQEFLSFKLQAEKWRAEHKKYLDGLSQAIELQLSAWDLSKSEKEVAFLLLKGLSLKDVAEVRGTSEKTARAQSTALYSKAGLNGRSELAAFFLEDLLLPTEPIK